MPKDQNVSLSVIRRLPRYYRFLGELLRNGVERISSKELSARMGLTASQIRQDLNCFGGFGQQGYGYNISALYVEIGNILGINKGFETILIGAGNLGRAITKHMNFEKIGFHLAGIFDVDPHIIGQRIIGLTIQNIDNLDSFCKQHHPVVAVLCVPQQTARDLANHLVELGVKGFWNFSHYDLTVDFENVIVENVHLGDSLMTLCYRVNELIG
ncbi:redox-sensing transcriptional repressor Rex [Candidatus Soleaferrea massiliensis]|uniref:redox-sensing transcriptional repressor Rex n=1 Tax=Candidatus Soleaferrea massiliensis TaxID=1470354 RepID=UPI00058AF2F9|nr:redox-sensing transcriptional repressor Rex [Candidatus Soleaferrea massiliensis]